MMSYKSKVALGQYYDEFLENEVRSGRFESHDDVIREGLRLLEIERNKVNALNEALEKGENSGVPLSFDNEAFKLKMKNSSDIRA